MKLLISALEHSANIHLRYLVRELGDEVELCGIFDSSLGESIVDLRSTSIMGFVDALKKLPFFFRQFYQFFIVCFLFAHNDPPYRIAA